MVVREFEVMPNMAYEHTARTPIGTFRHACTERLEYAVVYCGRDPTYLLRWAESVRVFHLSEAQKYELAAAGDCTVGGHVLSGERCLAHAAESRDAAQTARASWLTKHRLNADAIARRAGTCEAWTKTMPDAEAVAERLRREGWLDVLVVPADRRSSRGPPDSHSAPHRFDEAGRVVYGWGAAHANEPQPRDVTLAVAADDLRAAGLGYVLEEGLDRSQSGNVRVLAPWRFLLNCPHSKLANPPDQVPSGSDAATQNYRLDMARVVGKDTLAFLERSGVDPRSPLKLQGSRTDRGWTYDLEFVIPATLVLASREERWPFTLETAMWPEILVGIRAGTPSGVSLLVHAEKVPSRVDAMTRATEAVEKAAAAAAHARASLKRLERSAAETDWNAFVAIAEEHDRALGEASRVARSEGLMVTRSECVAPGRQVSAGPSKKRKPPPARRSLPDPSIEHGAALAHEIRAFLGWFLQRSDVETRALRIGKPASAAVVRRALKDQYLPPELVGLCSRMDGVTVEWRLRKDRQVTGALRIPSLSRNLRRWEAPGLEDDTGTVAATIRVLDEVPYSAYSMRAPVSMGGDFGWWDGDIFQPAGSVEEYLRSGMWNLFVKGWWTAGFDPRPGELTTGSLEARLALGMRLRP